MVLAYHLLTTKTMDKSLRTIPFLMFSLADRDNTTCTVPCATECTTNTITQTRYLCNPDPSPP
ncbi:hypothetical protein BKA56DRAFT_589249 [Ilyonectria sp. MPI-CAGE-AT-0026]|nr:hypothetical protein BKA56DRAFT_589249 [Ilyonectria sp. MPI-CAGE-AT-0026]